MRTDGRTDMTKLIVTFRNFANSPKDVRKPVTFEAYQGRCFVNIPDHIFFSPNYTFASTCILARVWDPVTINEEYRFMDLSKTKAFYSVFQNIFIGLSSKFQSHHCAFTKRRRKCIPTHSQTGVKTRWVVGITPGSPCRREIPGTFCAGGWAGLEASTDGTKNFTPSELDPRLVQPIASRCTY
jgi:hypothetical protein